MTKDILISLSICTNLKAQQNKAEKILYQSCIKQIDNDLDMDYSMLSVQYHYGDGYAFMVGTNGITVSDLIDMVIASPSGKVLLSDIIGKTYL